jgi:hypothetical protein
VDVATIEGHHPTIHLRQILERLEAMEGKLDLLMHRLDGLTDRLERGENYPLRNLPEPGNLNETPHLPGLG